MTGSVLSRPIAGIAVAAAGVAAAAVAYHAGWSRAGALAAVLALAALGLAALQVNTAGRSIAECIDACRRLVAGLALPERGLPQRANGYEELRGGLVELGRRNTELQRSLARMMEQYAEFQRSLTELRARHDAGSHAAEALFLLTAEVAAGTPIEPEREVFTQEAAGGRSDAHARRMREGYAESRKLLLAMRENLDRTAAFAESLANSAGSFARGTRTTDDPSGDSERYAAHLDLVAARGEGAGEASDPRQMEIERAMRYLRDRGDWAVDFADRVQCMATTIARFPKPKHHNPVGLDVDLPTLERMNAVLSGQGGLERYDEAQMRELAFWRWVAFEGYMGNDPRLLALHTEQLKVRTFLRTGWPLSELKSMRLVEIGCGPLGMINFLPFREAVGYDPLNRYYSLLFRGPRAGTPITYVDDEAYFGDKAGTFDLAICHNVLDHTIDPDRIFNMYAGLIREGGRFILQVNTVRADVARTDEHKAMHPSPLTAAQIRGWIGLMSDDFESDLRDEASTDGEFYFIAWGTKVRNPAAVYHRPEPLPGLARTSVSP